MGGLVYFSTKSENTHRFVSKLGLEAVRIPIRSDREVKADSPFVLVLPTYSGNDGRGAVPRQVERFLEDGENRSKLRGVIAGGNSNFGESFGLAGKVVSAKCAVPFLYRFELIGTPDDVDNVRNGLERLWKR